MPHGCFWGCGQAASGHDCAQQSFRIYSGKRLLRSRTEVLCNKVVQLEAFESHAFGSDIRMISRSVIQSSVYKEMNRSGSERLARIEFDNTSALPLCKRHVPARHQDTTAKGCTRRRNVRHQKRPHTSTPCHSLEHSSHSIRQAPPVQAIMSTKEPTGIASEACCACRASPFQQAPVSGNIP